jgi:TolB-like protein
VQQRARDFLGYVVAKTLLGEADQIKEMTVAIAVFGESADFDPAESAKVRAAASELRRRLEAYARGAGRHDVIQILLPLNTYVPAIHDQRIAIAIGEFENWNPQREQAHVPSALTAEIGYQLELAGFRVLLSGIQMGSTHTGQTPAAGLLRGSVEAQADSLRINLSLSSVDGRILTSRNLEGPRDELLRLAREVVAIVAEATDGVGVTVQRPAKSR